MSKLVLLICMLCVCIGCALGPSRLKDLGHVSASSNGPLKGLCLSVEVKDDRDDKSIYLMGAFNIFRQEAQHHIPFIRSEFGMAAKARGAKVGGNCPNGPLGGRSVHVAIQDLVYDTAWGYPITDHEFDVAMDVKLFNGSRTMMHEIKHHSGTRALCEGDCSNFSLQDLPKRCSLEIRRLVESFYDNSQVKAFLKQKTELSDAPATAQKITDY